MVRLIDADALIKDLEYDVELDARALEDTDVLLGRNRELVQFDKDCKQNAIDMLKKAPTADAVQVIRCKDCKHWLPHTQFGYDADYEEYHNYCNRHLPDDDFYAFIKEAEDYCSWAERKQQ